MIEPMRFVSGDLEVQWDSGEGHGVKIHPVLIELAGDFCRYAFTAHGWIPEVTSIVRSKEDDAALGGTAIHTLGRALDIRTRSIPPQIIVDCKAYIDKHWRYDKMRPKMSTCITKPHGSGPHVHLQVHANTERISG
jgi:hypothetical protein